MSARLLAVYLVVFAISAGLAATSFALGHTRHSQPDVAGYYEAGGACSGKFKVEQSGQFVNVSGAVGGKLRLRHRELRGAVRCGAAHTRVCFVVDGAHELRALSGCGGVTAKFVEELPKPGHDGGAGQEADQRAADRAADAGDRGGHGGGADRARRGRRASASRR